LYLPLPPPPPLLLLLLLLLHTRLRQLVALGHTDELQAEMEKFKQQPNDLRSHLDKVRDWTRLWLWRAAQQYKFCQPCCQQFAHVHLSASCSCCVRCKELFPCTSWQHLVTSKCT
jgi:hypothetical protein